MTTPTTTARLIGGRAHGRSCPVGDDAAYVFVTMVSGRPETLRSPERGDAAELLDRAHGSWEPYVQVPSLGPDLRGRFAYYCPRPLPSDHHEVTANQAGAGRVVEAFIATMNSASPPQALLTPGAAASEAATSEAAACDVGAPEAAVSEVDLAKEAVRAKEPIGTRNARLWLRLLGMLEAAGIELPECVALEVAAGGEEPLLVQLWVFREVVQVWHHGWMTGVVDRLVLRDWFRHPGVPLRAGDLELRLNWEQDCDQTPAPLLISLPDVERWALADEQTRQLITVV